MFQKRAVCFISIFIALCGQRCTRSSNIKRESVIYRIGIPKKWRKTILSKGGILIYLKM